MINTETVTPLLTVSLLFWSTLVFASVATALDGRSRQILRLSWKAIGVILLATALWRVPWDGPFFHGLEYEDSYVYTVAGRQMAEDVLTPSSEPTVPFSFSVCAMGSINDCTVWEPFPEHLIGYPYVIGIASRVFGYTPAVGSIVNLMASLLSALLVFMLAFTIAGDPLIALLSGLLFAVVPVFAVYGLETSAEPFSCCCILLTLWFSGGLWRTDAMSALTQGFRWCAYTCALLLSQTVKREDALLAVALPVLTFFAISQRDRTSRGRVLRLTLMITSSVLALFLSFKMHLLATSQNEQELLRQFPLTGSRLSGFIWSFIESFGVLRWYGGSSLAVLGGILFAMRKRSLAVIPMMLLVTFIFVYASHIRGYYEMESGKVSPESALRFSMNLMGLWAITGGLGLGWLVRWLQLHRSIRSRQEFLRYSLCALGAALLLVSLVTTFYLRHDAVEDEANSRVIPALVAVEAASLGRSAPAFILTMDPLVVQMYADPNTRVVDLESLDMHTVDELLTSKDKLLLLKQNDRFMKEDLMRYGEPIRRILSLPSRRLDGGDGFSVSLIDTNEAR